VTGEAPASHGGRGRSLTAAFAAAAVLLVVYVATMAPDVTLWDAGEFIAAGHALGIPHPPGTPLFVLLLRAWSRALWFLPTAVATNLFSAVATAVVGGVAAALVAQWTGRTAAGVAAALCAGGLSTVWLNATETEVYAATLALAVVSLACADRAGRTGDGRWLALVVYLVVLAVPLHMSALVMGPAVVCAAASDATGRLRWAAAATVSGAWLIALGVGTMSPIPLAVGVAVALVGARLDARATAANRGARVLATVGYSARFLAAAALAVSALVFLLIRARHDPAINQGAPMTLRTLSDVVARRQYDVAPLWPRRAPLWLQLANVFDYADWQVALSLGPTVFPTVLRTGSTVIFAVLGAIGAVQHRRQDVRGWRTVLLALLGGSLGVAIYLNLRAGPSFGWGVIPDNALREARERDYFFVIGFWAWGLWAGYGAVLAAERFRLPTAIGVGVAALPVLLNWSAVGRRRWPDRDLARLVGVSLLEASPRRAVLFVGGDNDTYPLWYAQTVLGTRRDVTVVTTPLLPAAWYRAELWRRHRLYDPDPGEWQGRTPTSRAIAERARGLGRPVAAAITMAGDERRSIASRWELRGPVFVENAAAGPALRVDTTAAVRWASRFEAWRRGRDASPSIDPTGQLLLDVLSCPGWVIGRRPVGGAPSRDTSSLASLCNLR
jgi:Protein of unknown function (DUF2723)